MKTPVLKSASWTPVFYGHDPSFAKGMMDVQFFLTGDSTDYVLSSSDEATAIKTVIKSISHPEYGEIQGVFNDGLDLQIVKCDGTSIYVNGEENPGEIDGSGKLLSTAPFSLCLHNPQEIDVTLAQYRSLFIQKSATLMHDFEEDRIRKALNICVKKDMGV